MHVEVASRKLNFMQPLRSVRAVNLECMCCIPDYPIIKNTVNFSQKIVVSQQFSAGNSAIMVTLTWADKDDP
jgi:hypothetical protein